jgi:hypothetical protein
MDLTQFSYGCIVKLLRRTAWDAANFTETTAVLMSMSLNAIPLLEFEEAPKAMKKYHAPSVPQWRNSRKPRRHRGSRGLQLRVICADRRARR